MEIRQVSIDKLNPAKYNPRKDLTPDDPEYQKLKRSLEEFGEVDPIVWNEATGNVVGGHQRLKILKEMGRKRLKVSVVNLTEKQEAVLNIALNKISGEWDYPKLRDIIAEIDSGEFDISLTGYDDHEIEDLMTFYGDEYKRPGFKDLIDDFEPIIKKSNKNENWFYVEYYGKDETFNELKKLFKSKNLLTGEHEIDSDAFLRIIKNTNEI